MAFFGLTALGSQNPFESAKETPIHVFEESDFQKAFVKTWQPNFQFYSEDEDEKHQAHHQMKTKSFLTFCQLEEMLRVLYKCPQGINNVPPSAIQLVKNEFASFALGNHPPMIALSTFLERMNHVKFLSEQKEEQEEKYKLYEKDNGIVQTREFTSNAEFRAALAKHHRMDKNPHDKNLVPVTDAQTIGWTQPTTFNPRKPTKSCEETKYASAMIKAGVYYY
jgi:hypothetical protein